MQTLESNKIVTPEGYFVSNVKLTDAGRKKFEQAFVYWYRGGYINNTISINNDENTWEYNDVSSDQFINDLEFDATSTETEPACRIAQENIFFVRDVDYIVEMQPFEVISLGRLAKELNELHVIMEQELARLGW